MPSEPAMVRPRPRHGRGNKRQPNRLLSPPSFPPCHDGVIPYIVIGYRLQVIGFCSMLSGTWYVTCVSCCSPVPTAGDNPLSKPPHTRIVSVRIYRQEYHPNQSDGKERARYVLSLAKKKIHGKCRAENKRQTKYLQLFR